MNEVIETAADKEFAKGLRNFREGSVLAALVCFEKAVGMWNKPAYFSYLGYCVAKERGQVQQGLNHCRQAIGDEPGNPTHYLNLGRIYLVAGNKPEAIRVFREGLAHGNDQDIIDLLDSIGTREKPIFSKLDRANPINHYLGKLLSKLGIR